MQQDIVFRGISAPLRLQGAASVLPLLPQVIAGWPFRKQLADPAVSPFFSISSVAEDALLRCEWHIDDRPARSFDAVNALCDAVSALAFALPAEDARLICLHAAAVEVVGRLVVFPNVRRAGKSTLSAALAKAGHRLFSDDVLPLFFSEDNRAWGLAMGIAPRLRLPLPDKIPRDFHDWVATVGGPRNRQYQYLRLADQPAHGVTRPVSAFVILDRQEGSVEARLDPVAPDQAMDALLHQNFTRDRHSGDILRAMAATLTERPVFRLTYSDLSGAVDCLERALPDWLDDSPVERSERDLSFKLADFYWQVEPASEAGEAFRQRSGTVAERIGGTLYLADAEGRAIHRMDGLASAIWSLLEDPVPSDEIEDLLSDAFPETERDQIASDLSRLLGTLEQAGLIERSAEV